MYINTGQEFDGSDSGARPDEAVSWGKIRAGAESVKVRLEFAHIWLVARYRPLTLNRFDPLVYCVQVYADATLVFPLVVAATFGKAHWAAQN